MIKKISAFILSLTLAVGCFASCDDKDSKKDDSSKTSSSSASKDESKTDSNSSADASSQAEVPEPSLTIDGKKIDTKNYTMCTIDGEKIDFDTFRYFYYTVLQSYAQYGITIDSIKSTEGAFDNFMQEVIDNICSEYVAVKLAKEAGIELNDDDQKQIEENIKKFKANFSSDEEYKNQLKQLYITEAGVKDVYHRGQYYQKLFTNNGKYATKKEDLKKAVKDNEQYSRVIHILIPYECQTEITDSSALDEYKKGDLTSKSNAKKTAYNALDEKGQNKVKTKSKKLAEEVLAKAKKGDDFEKLMKEYGWDPGMESQPDGYFVTQSSNYVKEFKTAAFKLKENEISDLVENESYGWFIIKRLPIDTDYIEKNYDTILSEYDNTRIQKIFKDTIAKMKVEKSEDFSKITADSIK